MRRIDNIVFHCTGGPQNQTVPVIKEYWKKVKGWKSPGYHHIVLPDGTDVELLLIDQISNGVAGHNANSIHICYIGGVEVIKIKNSKGQPINTIGRPIDNRTPQQLITLERLARKYHKAFPDAEIRGHRDFSIDKNRDGVITPNEWGKACPSFSVSSWLKSIKILC